MSKISVSRDDEVHRKVDITLKDPDKEVIKKYREEITKKKFWTSLQTCFDNFREIFSSDEYQCEWWWCCGGAEPG